MRIAKLIQNLSQSFKAIKYAIFQCSVNIGHYCNLLTEFRLLSNIQLLGMYLNSTSFNHLYQQNIISVLLTFTIEMLVQI